MSLYFCTLCDRQKDGDIILPTEWDDGFICEDCLTEVQSNDIGYWQSIIVNAEADIALALQKIELLRKPEIKPLPEKPF